MSSANNNMAQPYLLVTSGELKGSRFIIEDEFVIGRQGAALALTDMSVSRRHCVIRKHGAQYVITDLGSHNGTIVNGEQVKERVLENGDQITVGDIGLVAVLSDEDRPPMTPEVEFSDQDVDLAHTVLLKPENADYLKAETALAHSATDKRIREDLQALLRIGTTVSSGQHSSSVPGRLMELILEVIPADAGAILVHGPTGSTISLVAKGFKGSQRVSRTVVERVLGDRTAILSNQIPTDGIDASSLIASEAHALLCVPLIVHNRAIGVIYLLRTTGRGGFEERHLQLLTAIAAMTALPLDTVRQVEWLTSENQRLRTSIDADHQMIGNSSAINEIYSFISRVAATDSTVLIEGESGTGKELVARAIHRMSARARMPFIAVNCAAMTETLVESELFGHEKGAFTGAMSQNKGKFETAEGGTIFLDEVGELPLSTQSKLLRVLQEREINRVGNPRPIRINVRIVAATNRDLEEEIRNGRFRKDLFYRLHVVTVSLPALRDRRVDIMPLTEFFIARSSVRCHRNVKGISKEAAEYLMTYDWPGNVRELENAVERAVVLGLTDTILPEDLPESVLDARPPASSAAKMDGFHNAIREAKRQLIQRALDQAAGNHLEAAKLLGLNRTYLHRLIRTLDL
jgi:transcriptional regulator with GAF, ATPase, and Fis domain